jgi:hypothetical protein
MNTFRSRAALLGACLALSAPLSFGCKPMLYPAARMFGSPPERELAACRAQYRRLQTDLPGASLVVHPPCIFTREGNRWDRALSAGISQALAARGFHPVAFEGPDPRLEGKGPGANQMRFTWNRARDYARWTAETQPEGAWHLYSDLLVDAGGTIRGMEIYILDGQGHLALVRLVNSHHPVFQGIQAGSLPSGCEVLAETLQNTLRLPPERLYPPYGVG